MATEGARSQIQQLLVVLSSAVLSGFLIAGYFLYVHGPSGQYQLNNVLLAPNLMHTLSFKDEASKKTIRYQFKKLEFTFFDAQQKKWQIHMVSPEKYQSWYSQVESDKSLSAVTEEVRAQFVTAFLPSLVLTVNQEGSPDSTRVAQEVQFANEGNHYRVRLYEQGSSDNWAYFAHDNILALSINQLSAL